MQKEFEIKNNVLLKYHEQNGKIEVVIPEGVEIIREFSFSSCTNITSISIPNSVKYIGESAFRDCLNLKSINIPDSVIDIDMFCFQSCTNLENIELPNKLTRIACCMFRECTNLESISIPNSVIEIESGAFDDCEKLENISIPEGVTKIGEMAFYGAKIANIMLPNSIESINADAFDSRYVKRISVPSYDVFYKIHDFELKVIVLDTIIKDKQYFSEKDKVRFKKYIIEHKYSIFDLSLGNNNLLDLLGYMLNDIEQIYNKEEIDSMLKDVTTLNEISNKAQITSMLLEYKRKNIGFQNPLDEYDLGKFKLNEDENEKGRLL